MTKRELLDFLLPFDDEIKIVVEEDMGLLDDARPLYKIAPLERTDYANDELRKHGITPGEGYVVI